MGSREDPRASRIMGKCLSRPKWLTLVLTGVASKTLRTLIKQKTAGFRGDSCVESPLNMHGTRLMRATRQRWGWYHRLVCSCLVGVCDENLQLPLGYGCGWLRKSTSSLLVNVDEHDLDGRAHLFDRAMVILTYNYLISPQ